MQGAVEAYERARTDFDHLGKTLLLHLAEDESLRHLIHSSKYRTKNPDHLHAKLLRKELSAPAKKGVLTPDNVFSQVDDLAGVRLIHLHTAQLKQIHPAVLTVFSRNNYKLRAKPFAYCWDLENRELLRSLGIRAIERPEMYTSVHYVISSPNRPDIRAELQVRTIMEEVWGEVSHSIDYPEPSPVFICREQLKALARFTSGCARLVDCLFASHDPGAIPPPPFSKAPERPRKAKKP